MSDSSPLLHAARLCERTSAKQTGSVADDREGGQQAYLPLALPGWMLTK